MMPNQRQANISYYMNPTGTISVTTSDVASWGRTQALLGVLGDNLYIQTDSYDFEIDDIPGYPGLLSFNEPCVYLFSDLERAIFGHEGTPENATSKKLVAQLKKLIGLTVRATPYDRHGERYAYIQAEFTAQTPVRSNGEGQKELGTLGSMGEIAPPDLPILNEPDLRMGQNERIVRWSVMDDQSGIFAILDLESEIQMTDGPYIPTEIEGYSLYLMSRQSAELMAKQMTDMDDEGREYEPVRVKFNPTTDAWVPAEEEPLPDLPILNEPDLRMGELDRRAQADNKRLFIEDLYNLKSSIADILRDDDSHLQSDIVKLLVDHTRVVRQDPRIADLGIGQALKDMQTIAGEQFENSISRYKRYNNFYNERVVRPIKENLGLWGVRVDPSMLENGPLDQSIVQPKSVSLIPKIPQYLKLQKIPQVLKGRPSKSWHEKLADVEEMLKVLGHRYLPAFEKLLQTFEWIDQDSHTLINLEDNRMVNSHIEGAGNFYEVCRMITKRMETAKLIAVRGAGHIYVLEEIPNVYRFSPTANRELVDVLWKDYVQSGTTEDLATRMQQLVEDRSVLQKKFKMVFQQWSLMYKDTASRVGVEVVQPVELQLVRYGQQIISDRDIVDQLNALTPELDRLVEETRDVTSTLAGMRIRIEGEIKKGLGGEEFPALKVAGKIMTANEFEKLYLENPISGVSVKFADYKDNTIEINEINADQPGQGQGTKAMNRIIELADKTGTDLHVVPAFEYDNERFYRLVSFYKRFGFELDSAGQSMYRRSRMKKIAQLRKPVEAPVKLEIPPEYGPAPEIPYVQGVPAKPPKLPVSDEFLPLLSDYDLNLYYSVDEKLSPPQAISMAGRNEMLVMMTYQKAYGTGDPDQGVTSVYTLEPYSYRYRRTKNRGQRKYFFAFDQVDNTIKCFLVGGIKSVQILPEKFSPRWEVEFR